MTSVADGQGMNPVLKRSATWRAEQDRVYRDSTIAIDPTLINAIPAFVLAKPRI